jgi:hypothetical protein
MAERHGRTPVEVDPEAVIDPTLTGAEGEPEHKQEHTVAKGSLVTAHGGRFPVKDETYHWHLHNPKGQEVPLMDATSPEPSFVAADTGEYVLRVATDTGRVQFTFHVVD